MTKKKRAADIIRLLNENYKIEIKCFLNYTAPYELLISTILSAQCTDDRVNLVTADLFQKYASIDDFANADLPELERDIHSTGFYHNKAKNIISSMRILRDKYGNEMPSALEDLLLFPGVGRKTANVVRGHVFNIPSIVVDTHVKRVSKRLGLTKNTDPEKVEFDLMKILPKKDWIAFNIQIITHGRRICKARGESCESCFLAEVCKARVNIPLSCTAT